MSRFAQARAQAGLAPLTDDNVWEQEASVAEALVTGRPLPVPSPPVVAPLVAPPPAAPPVTTRRVVRAATVPAASRHELSPLIERVFLGPGRSRARSVLFCSEPGAFAPDTAWHAAELLATASSGRVAFVEDGSNGVRRSTNARVVWIGWYAPDPTPTRQTAAAPAEPVAATAPDATLGDRISDLFASFDYVVVTATAADPHDLVPLTHEVDGVVIVVDAQRTRRQTADRLASTLRDAGTHLLGAVFLEAAV